ncbi:thiamine-phosphate pyrophosphorylase [Weissella beninensis]|uniref:Thiamine-phosphate synthase n=1 Tax=Periweissella beninensis TaxID=504936 RepID=A0ABT0VG41_9LACO|nr:thiamine phosphate synthase [Periweissella beninensis]MBM7543828.1 thiamine-phosphate pyrophosphorylase [Periweissella beninensis]MCM2436791.1 thiamine phosphate synthase [Periweissella beninensis]
MLKFETNMLQCYLVVGRQDLKPGTDILEFVATALASGVTAVQYREKGLMAPNDTTKQAIALGLRRVTKQYNVPLIIDDDWQLALQCQADGIHIGQSDVKVTELVNILTQRSLRPPFIGLSVSTPEQMPNATIASHLSYIGSGPIFATNSKQDADPVIGIAGLRKIIAITNLPIVAIGGIDYNNIQYLKNLPISGVAIISALTKAPINKLPTIVQQLKFNF